MNKKIGIGIAVAAVVVVAGAVGTSYVMGGKLEDGFKDSAVQLSRHNIKVEVTSYERGTFSSHAKTLWTMEQGGDPLQFTAEHDISHGPLPRGHAAEIHTVFSLPNGSREDLVAALNGRAPVELTTAVGWGWGTSNVMTSPVVTGKINDADMNWGGMKIEWDMPADMKAAKGTASFPAFKSTAAEGGSLALDNTTMRFDIKQPKDKKFWTGPFAMIVANLTIQPEDADKQPSSIKNLSMDTDTILKDDVLEMIFKTRIQNAQIEDKKADDIVLEAALHNIDANWVNQVVELSQRKDLMKSNDKESDDDEAQATQDEQRHTDLRDELFKTVTQMLARQPEFEIKNLSMRTKDGVSEFAAAIKYLGDGANLRDLPKDVKVSLNAKLPKPAMEGMMTARTRNSLIENLGEEDHTPEEFDEAAKTQALAHIQMLQEHGIFEEKDGVMNTQIVYEKGAFQVNGKPLDATGTSVLFGTLTE